MYSTIEEEMSEYLKDNSDLFKDKVVLCPCDDYEKSNFIKYFRDNFKQLGLKRLIGTCYIDEVLTKSTTSVSLFSDNGDLNLKSKKLKIHGKFFDKTKEGELTGFLEGNGDFRSIEVSKLRDSSDFIITNPPFHLYLRFVRWLNETNIKYSILGNINSVSCKNVFPLIMNHRMWLGYSIHSGDVKFRVPETYPLYATNCKVDECGKKYIAVKGIRWFTNIPLKRENGNIISTKKYSANKYVKYENFDAIEINSVADIPMDYEGIMGVPITFLDKYNPNQFEIVGISNHGRKLATKIYMNEECPNCNYLNSGAVISDNGVLRLVYSRIFIRKK